jgi:hypothetical protein
VTRWLVWVVESLDGVTQLLLRGMLAMWFIWMCHNELVRLELI